MLVLSLFSERLFVFCSSFHFRDVLEDECAQRRRDILFLQDCLDGEKEHRRAAVTEAARSEPTLQGVYVKLMSRSRTKIVMDCNKIRIKASLEKCEVSGRGRAGA